MKNIIRNKKSIIILLVASFGVALLAHAFFIKEWFEGRYMAGIGDGVSQMISFKYLLYNEYKTGNFFYSSQFGMGGGIYSQLSYYFSTSIFFILSVMITFMLEAMRVVKVADLFYWADAILVISVIRMTLIIIVTTFYFRYMTLKNIPAFIGAVLYGTSVIYFRHAAYWEFFADAMLWLPIILYGVEKIIQEKKSGIFIVAIAISLFDNFYFAYINFLLVGIYIVGRAFFTLAENETKILQQVKLYFVGGLMALGISAISFFPAVYGYMNNHRIPYEGVIRLIGVADNPLMDGRVIVIPAFVMLCLFVKHFYNNKLFQFFAVLTIFSIGMHFSPFVASVFNGFSAPQYRWEYFLASVGGGAVAVSLQNIQMLTRRSVIFAIVPVLILYVLAYFVDPFLPFKSWQQSYLLFTTSATIIVFALLSMKKREKIVKLLPIYLIIISLVTSNFFQKVKLSETGNLKQVSRDWMVSEEYIGTDQKELIDKIKASESEPFYRIDWMVPTRNNTPIVQDFHGFSVYSSILNNHLLYFYLYDLEIDMGRESVSRYGTLGSRANLHSMLMGKYYITDKNRKSIPYGFEKVYGVGDYVAYENKHMLPFVRTTKNVYAEKHLESFSPLTRERAMLDGIVLENLASSEQTNLSEVDLFPNVKVKAKKGKYADNILEVTGKKGGLDLIIENQNGEIADYYISFYLKRLDKNELFELTVNEFETSRKSNTSIYRTGVDDITIRVAATDKISIRMPKGKYELKDLQLYAEDYELLKAVKDASEQNVDVPYTWSKNKVTIDFENNVQDKYMALPIPFEKGWTLKVNGEKREVLQANYSFIGLEIADGKNKIELVYYPPYFFPSLILTIVSLVGVLYLFVRRKWVFHNKDEAI